MEKLIVAERAQPAGKLKNLRRAGLITPVKRVLTEPGAVTHRHTARTSYCLYRGWHRSA